MHGYCTCKYLVDRDDISLTHKVVPVLLSCPPFTKRAFLLIHWLFTQVPFFMSQGSPMEHPWEHHGMCLENTCGSLLGGLYNVSGRYLWCLHIPSRRLGDVREVCFVWDDYPSFPDYLSVSINIAITICLCVQLFIIVVQCLGYC